MIFSLFTIEFVGLIAGMFMVSSMIPQAVKILPIPVISAVSSIMYG